MIELRFDDVVETGVDFLRPHSLRVSYRLDDRVRYILVVLFLTSPRLYR
nr:hypothetical protein [Halorussus litoreus]